MLCLCSKFCGAFFEGVIHTFDDNNIDLLLITRIFREVIGQKRGKLRIVGLRSLPVGTKFFRCLYIMYSAEDF